MYLARSRESRPRGRLGFSSAQRPSSFTPVCWRRQDKLRWGSVYLGDMRKLPEDAPTVYENFKAGKFVVKRTQGKCNSVGGDMCLEQTINRSQKIAGGIIGSTERKKVCYSMGNNSPRDAGCR